MQPTQKLAAVIAGLTALGPAGLAPVSEARADTARRAPVPEPLLTETVTDIDGSDRGEFELELNGSELGSVRGGALALQSSLEGEWLATRTIGLRLEPAFSRSVGGPQRDANHTLGGSGGLSFKFVQDFEREIYAQAEVTGRLPFDTTPPVEPAESALPVTFDVRSALRRGRWTLRGSIGMAAGGSSASVPVRGGAAVLTGFGSSERYGFWGVEADIDGTRRNSTTLALNLVPHLGPIGLPFRFGLAIPWVVGASGDRPSTGLFLRILFESAREYEYGQTGK